jgi:hypothetical protein
VARLRLLPQGSGRPKQSLCRFEIQAAFGPAQRHLSMKTPDTRRTCLVAAVLAVLVMGGSLDSAQAAGFRGAARVQAALCQPDEAVRLFERARPANVEEERKSLAKHS